MEKHYYIRGNAEHPEKVIAELEKRGGKNDLKEIGNIADAIYFIDYTDGDGIGVALGLVADIITSHPDWEEIFPEPDYKFKVGDVVRFKTQHTFGHSKITQQIAHG